MAELRPTDKARRLKQKRLDFLNERLLHLREVGKLQGYPEWESFKKYLQTYVKAAEVEEGNYVKSCDSEEMEPWQVVAGLRGARRTRDMALTVLAAIDGNAGQVAECAALIQAATQDLQDYDLRLAELGEGGDHAHGT